MSERALASDLSSSGTRQNGNKKISFSLFKFDIKTTVYTTENGIAIHARHFGANLTPAPGIEQARTRKRSIDSSVILFVPSYNAGDRCRLRARTFVEVKAEEILAEARKKNLPWILVRLHAKEKQKGSGWTGFNISVRNKVQVSQNVIGYLPTIDAPASDMASVHEVLVQSLKINRIRSS